MVQIFEYSKFAPFKLLFIFPFFFQWLLLSQVINFYFSVLNVSGIEMISKTSIYPCYSQFLILFTELMEFEDEKRFIRLVRVYTSDSRQNEDNVQKLSYQREYKLPNNHVLQLNCSKDFPLFPPSTIKYYCFQFVAKDKVTRIVYDKIHRPKCRPTLLVESESIQRTFIVPNEVINQNIQAEVNKVEYLQNREYSNEKNKKRYNWTRRREAKTVNINCECVPKVGKEEEANDENAIVPKSVMYDPEYPAILLHVTLPSCPVAISTRSSDKSNFGQGSNICVLTFVPDTNEETERNSEKIGPENGKWKKGSAITSFDLQLLSVEEIGSQSNVKEGNVAESYEVVSEEHQKQKKSIEKEEEKSEKSSTVSTRDILLTKNQLKFRDGSSRIDPLILVSDYSIINQVTSAKLRIERSTKGFLQHSGLEVRMRMTGKDEANEQERKERFMARNQVNEQSSTLLRYFMYGFGGFLVLASVSFLLTCLTSSIRPHTVTIISRHRREEGKFEQDEGDEDEQEHLTSESHPPPSLARNGSNNGEEGKCSLSQFDLEPDSNSLEMDYYDYHQGNLSVKNLTIGKKVEIETCNKILSCLDRSHDAGTRKEEDEDSIQNIDSD